MDLASVGVRPGDGLGEGEGGGGEGAGLAQAHRDHARRIRGEVEGEEAGGGGGAAGDDGQELPLGRGNRILEAGVLGGDLKLLRFAVAAAVDDDEAAKPLALPNRNDTPRWEHGQHADALAPGGRPVLAVPGGERTALPGVAVVAVEVTPAGRVGNVVEGVAVRGESGLEDGFVGSARHYR